MQEETPEQTERRIFGKKLWGKLKKNRRKK